VNEMESKVIVIYYRVLHDKMAYKTSTIQYFFYFAP
jgi:hypothetical protein